MSIVLREEARAYRIGQIPSGNLWKSVLLPISPTSQQGLSAAWRSSYSANSVNSSALGARATTGIARLFGNPNTLLTCASCAGGNTSSKNSGTLPSKGRVATTSVANLPSPQGGSAVERVVKLLQYIEEHVVTSVYKADTKVDLDRGNFEFDCSGMVNWILAIAAPKAHADLQSSRAVVATYVKMLQAIPYDQPTQNWRNVKRIEDAEAGDVIAWPTPKDWYPSTATGHMGIIVKKPEKVSGGYLVRIADSTSLPHGEDSRSGASGFGYGTIFITTDPDTGIGTGQGWTGRYSGNTVIKTPIVVGRPLR